MNRITAGNKSHHNQEVSMVVTKKAKIRFKNFPTRTEYEHCLKARTRGEGNDIQQRPKEKKSFQKGHQKKTKKETEKKEAERDRERESDGRRNKRKEEKSTQENRRRTTNNQV
jgi:hypothetical protein